MCFWLCLLVASGLTWTGIGAQSAANENTAHNGACTELEFHCMNDQCIPLGKVCDEYPDCNDLSDENKTMCNERECYPSAPFLCENTGMCISNNSVCDGHEDCNYGEDEALTVCEPDLPPPTFDIHLPDDSDETTAATEARVRRAAVFDRATMVKTIRKKPKNFKNSKRKFVPPSKRRQGPVQRALKPSPYKRPPPGPARMPDPRKAKDY